MTDPFLKNLLKRKDIFTHSKSNNPIIVIICIVFAIITGIWISKIKFIEVACDFFDKMPEERVARIVTQLPEPELTLERDSHKKWITEEKQITQKALTPQKRQSATGRTGGGGDPKARINKKGVLGIISGAVKEKTVASGDLLGNAGFSSGIDAVLSGMGGLKSGDGGSGRKGSIGVGFGEGTNEMSNLIGSLSDDKDKTIESMETNKNINYSPSNYQSIPNKPVIENKFIYTVNTPVSTFSIDVDVASYINTRRYLKNNQLPPPSTIRIEEMINYFSYDYPFPKGKEPFSTITEIGDCPWNRENRLVHIGIKGRKISKKAPTLNFVFLIDISGSMTASNKLPLLKKSLRLLVNNLKDNDRIALVTYAGEADIRLNSTPGSQKDAINSAIEGLTASGSTAGSEGLELAYRIAGQNFLENGNNRVILLTDGDFNVGTSNENELIKLINRRKVQDIFLTVLGFGINTTNDQMMEKLAQEGDGNYSIIDDIYEAKRVLVEEANGTFFIVGNDVKIQVEFNPDMVDSYRLIGYENRLLKVEDFANDKVDAGDIGSEQNVTALYEIVPVHKKYDQILNSENSTDKLFTLNLRYKDNKSSASKLIVKDIIDNNTSLEMTSDDFKFSAAVAGFGMLLKGSKFSNNNTFDAIYNLANSTIRGSSSSKRHEFLWLVRKCEEIFTRQDLYAKY